MKALHTPSMIAQGTDRSEMAACNYPSLPASEKIGSVQAQNDDLLYWACLQRHLYNIILSIRSKNLRDISHSPASASWLSSFRHISGVIMLLTVLFLSLYGCQLAISAPAQTITTGNADYLSNTNDAIARLQKWYNQQTGQWNTTGWWNSANALTMLADFAAISAPYKSAAVSVFENTYGQAPQHKNAIVKVNNATTVETFTWPNIPHDLGTPVRVTNGDFLNDFYDDEGWWALAWIRAYDVTNEFKFLNTAMAIFADMARGYNATCGGIWWNKQHQANVAIANELFLAVAASLANRSSNRPYYLNWALQQWRWFLQSGLINRDLNINDGLDLRTCQNNNGTVWTYNQGVVLGALVELNIAQADSSYLKIATSIARAALKKLSGEDGILHEPCEPNCGGDGNQFKGIFMRNLQLLQEASPQPDFKAFILKNADSIWANDRSQDNQLGLVWSGPFKSATASTQSSALDALVAAVAIAGGQNITQNATATS